MAKAPRGLEGFDPIHAINEGLGSEDCGSLFTNLLTRLPGISDGQEELLERLTDGPIDAMDAAIMKTAAHQLDGRKLRSILLEKRAAILENLKDAEASGILAPEKVGAALDASIPAYKETTARLYRIARQQWMEAADNGYVGNESKSADHATRHSKGSGQVGGGGRGAV